ncbi:MAG: PspC domain-containing protein [Actinobacteria bacterium]|nr:PspC domain-containing protein [Actinomycetota bacterium]
MDEAETPDGPDQTAVATAEAVAPQTPHGPRRPLRRRAGHRLFAGVAGGLADYAGVRPMVFRLAFVLFTVAGGLGLLIYLLLWWVVPREDLPDSAGERLLRRFPNAPSWAGIGLLMLGAVLLAGQFGLWRPNVLWAFLLIGLGVVLFKRDAERQAPERARAASPVEPPVTAGELERPAMFEPLPEPRPPRPRSSLGWLTFGGMLLALGMAAVLDNLGAIRPWVGQYPALALGILGAGLVVGAWWGRARSLILLGLLLVPVVLAGPGQGSTRGPYRRRLRAAPVPRPGQKPVPGPGRKPGPRPDAARSPTRTAGRRRDDRYGGHHRYRAEGSAGRGGRQCRGRGRLRRSPLAERLRPDDRPCPRVRGRGWAAAPRSRQRHRHSVRLSGRPRGASGPEEAARRTEGAAG